MRLRLADWLFRLSEWVRPGTLAADIETLRRYTHDVLGQP